MSARPPSPFLALCASLSHACHGSAVASDVLEASTLSGRGLSLQPWRDTAVRCPHGCDGESPERLTGCGRVAAEASAGRARAPASAAPGCLAPVPCPIRRGSLCRDEVCDATIPPVRHRMSCAPLGTERTTPRRVLRASVCASHPPMRAAFDYLRVAPRHTVVCLPCPCTPLCVAHPSAVARALVPSHPSPVDAPAACCPLGASPSDSSPVVVVVCGPPPAPPPPLEHE